MDETKENVLTPERVVRFQGRLVRVYLLNGGTLRGYAVFEDGWLLLSQQEKGPYTAMCNLQHVVSLTEV